MILCRQDLVRFSHVTDGFLCYEFNLFEITRKKIRSKERLLTGKVKVEIESKIAAKNGGAMDVLLKVNNAEVANLPAIRETDRRDFAPSRFLLRSHRQGVEVDKSTSLLAPQCRDQSWRRLCCSSQNSMAVRIFLQRRCH